LASGIYDVKGGEMKKLICPSCNTRYGVRVRIKTKELVCNKCGYIGKIKKEGYNEVVPPLV
jgi:ribosomal protein L37AE/L43A